MEENVQIKTEFREERVTLDQETAQGGGLYVLVYDQVGCKAKHVHVTLLVGPPAQTERHEEEPGVLQQSHLIIQVQVPESCGEEQKLRSMRQMTPGSRWRME